MDSSHKSTWKRVADPFGSVWTIATLKEEVAPAEMQRRMKAEGY